MRVDKHTKEYFANIKQVFLYLGDKCNLFCEQCLYKPNVVMGRLIKPETAMSLLGVFRELGAFKLTILGGEISMYDIDNKWNALKNILEYSKDIGYRYIRIDTNGQREDFFTEKEVFEKIDEISFSIDGYDKKSNDLLRGNGAFDRAKNNLKRLRILFPEKRINITACVTRQNTIEAGGIDCYIHNMVDFAEKMDVNQLNFHGVFKMGVPMDTWTGASHLNPKEWASQIKNLKIEARKVDVRFPLHLVSHEEFSKFPAYYGYCPCKLGERALIHPDGIIRVCSSMLSTPYGVAHYNEREIVWNCYNNELINHKMDEYTPCTNQKALYSDEYCPICFSIKPHQDEVVWVNGNVEGLREKVLTK